MSRALVIYHTGEVYGRDSLRLDMAGAGQGADRLIAMYNSVGETIAYDSTLKLLEADEIVAVNPRAIDDGALEWINAECDYVLIRGSRYLESDADCGNLGSFLKKLTIPLVAPDIRVSAFLGTRARLSPSAVAILRALADRSASLGVAGYITAQTLYDVGVNNLRIVGCPSMFRALQPAWQPDLVKLESVRHGPPSDIKLALSVRREIGSYPVSDVDQYLQTQKRLITELMGHTRLQLIAQDGQFEKYFFLCRFDLCEYLYEDIIESGWAAGVDDAIFDVYRKALYYSADILAFAKHLGAQDMATGFRTQSILVALAQGVPGVMIDVDNSTHEIIDTFALPWVGLQSAQSEAILNAAREHDYNHLARQYKQGWSEMMSLLDENNIPHRMGEDACDEPEAQTSMIRPPWM